MFPAHPQHTHWVTTKIVNGLILNETPHFQKAKFNIPHLFADPFSEDFLVGGSVMLWI